MSSPSYVFWSLLKCSKTRNVERSEYLSMIFYIRFRYDGCIVTRFSQFVDSFENLSRNRVDTKLINFIVFFIYLYSRRDAGKMYRLCHGIFGRCFVISWVAIMESRSRISHMCRSTIRFRPTKLSGRSKEYLNSALPIYITIRSNKTFAIADSRIRGFRNFLVR